MISSVSRTASKNSKLQLFGTVKWRRRPAMRAHNIHELLDVGQCFDSLLLYSCHRRLDGMGPIYPARPIEQKWNNYFPTAQK
jgi:hypothetical protein